MTAAGVDLRSILPELIITGTLLVVMLWDAAGTRTRRGLALLSLLGVGAALAALRSVGERPAAFGGMYVRDGATQVLQAIALATAGIAILLSPEYLRRMRLARGEYYALLLGACLGAMIMAASTDFLLLFLGLETLSLPLYVLAGFRRSHLPSQESGLKYFLLGSFSTAFFLYGVALIFGVTGSTSLAAATAAARLGVSALLGGGIALITIGLAFKAALVPFHVWAPDVYEGAPLPVTAYMSVIAKVGALAAFVRVFTLALPALADHWGPLLVTLSIVTMVYGNLVALLQRSMKRLLAYSSIAHAGYLLIGVAAGNPVGTWALAFYLVAYVLMTLGAFAVILLLERAGEEVDRIDDYAGLAGRAPWLAAAMTVFMASLAGLPPTAGFIGKFYLFNAALEGGQVALALVGALSTVVSVYYYLRVPYVMFMGTAAGEVGLLRAPLTRLVVLAAATAVLLLGILPGALTRAVQPLALLVTGR